MEGIVQRTPPKLDAVTFLVSDPGLIWFVQCHMCFLIYCVVPVILWLFDCPSLYWVDLYGRSSLDPFHWPACMKPISEEWHILSGKHLVLNIFSHLLLKTQSNLTESTEFLSVSGNKGSNFSTWRWHYLLLVSLLCFYEPICMFDSKTDLLMETKTLHKSREIQSLNDVVRIHNE